MCVLYSRPVISLSPFLMTFNYYNYVEKYNNKKQNLENVYNLNIQQKEKEKYDFPQAYNSLASEIEKQKILSLIN
jgi:hypothetical protein